MLERLGCDIDRGVDFRHACQADGCLLLTSGWVEYRPEAARS
jgi:putative SOS response-associated peptidase YedK